MMFRRLSDADKLNYENRMCSLAEVVALKEEFNWSPGSSLKESSFVTPLGGAVGLSAITLAADQTIVPGLLTGLKVGLFTVGVAAAKVAIIVGVTGLVVYLLVPNKKKETH